MDGLAGLGQAADRLKRLNLGWCQGLASGATSASTDGSGLSSDGSPHGHDNNDSDDDNDIDIDASGEEGGGNGGRGEGGRPQSRRRRWGRGMEGGDGEGRAGGREEWALPPLPRLAKLCLARCIHTAHGCFLPCRCENLLEATVASKE